MINKENIIKAKTIIGKEILDNLELADEKNTKEYGFLCQADNYLVLLISELNRKASKKAIGGT